MVAVLAVRPALALAHADRVSQPFWGRQSVSVPFSGVTDANGVFTFETILRQVFWCNVKMVLLAGGSSQTVLRVAGIVAGFGTGPRIEIGSILVPPTAKVNVSVVTAAANVNVEGAFQGYSTPDQADAAQSYVPVANAVSAVATSPAAPLATIVAGTVASVTKTIAMPPGAYALGITVTQDFGSSEIASIKVVGTQSQRLYYQSPLWDPNVSSPPLPIWVNFLPTFDSSLDVTIQSVGGGPGTQITAHLEAEMFPMPTPARQVNVASWESVTSTKTGFQAIAAAGTFTIIPATLGRQIVVYGWDGVIDTSAAGAQIQFEATDGSTLLMYVSGGSANAYQPWRLPKPKPLNAGVGIRANNVGTGTANIAGTLYTLP